MASSATVTAKAGPNLSVTAVVVNNVSDINFDLDGKVLQLFQSSALPVREFDLNGITTVTCTVTAGPNFAFTLS